MIDTYVSFIINFTFVSSCGRIEETASELEAFVETQTQKFSNVEVELVYSVLFVRNGGACRVLGPYPILPWNSKTTTTTTTRWKELRGRQAASSCYPKLCVEGDDSSFGERSNSEGSKGG